MQSVNIIWLRKELTKVSALKGLIIRFEGNAKFVQKISSALNVINDVFRDLKEVWVIQGRMKEHPLIARIETFRPFGLTVIHMPKPITDHNFYVMCHDFTHILAKHKEGTLPRLAEATQNAVTLLTELEDSIMEKTIFLLEKIVVPLHFMVCELLALEDFPELRDFYSVNLPLLAKEVKNIESSTVIRIGLGMFFNTKCKMSSNLLEEFQILTVHAYESALSGNMSRHKVDLVELMVKAHKLLRRPRKNRTTSMDRSRSSDNVPLMYS